MNQSTKQHIVNAITYSRIIGIPFLFLIRENSILLFIIASLMFITDFFDGFLARKWNVTSTRGAILDLIADKFLVIVLLVYGVIFYEVNIILCILIVFREIYSMVIRFNTMKKGNDLISASLVGKTKTAFQFLGLALMMLLPDYEILNTHLYNIIFVIVVVLSYYSFASYFKLSRDANE